MIWIENTDGVLGLLQLLSTDGLIQFQNNEKLSLGSWKTWLRLINTGGREIKVTLIVFI